MLAIYQSKMRAQLYNVPKCLDPCDICHFGRRNNTIYPLWEMKSSVMQKYFIVLSSSMAYVAGVYYKYSKFGLTMKFNVYYCVN